MIHPGATVQANDILGLPTREVSLGELISPAMTTSAVSICSTPFWSLNWFSFASASSIFIRKKSGLLPTR